MKAATESRARQLWQRLIHRFPMAGQLASQLAGRPPDQKGGPPPGPNGMSPAPPPPSPAPPPPPPPPPLFDRVQIERNIEARLRERLDGRLDDFSHGLERRLSERLERELPGRVCHELRGVLAREGEREERKQAAQAFRLLEERLTALQEELAAERREKQVAVERLRAEQDRHAALVVEERARYQSLERAREAERALAEQAEAERSKAREETHAFRRVLAAAIANEKYALQQATASVRTAKAQAKVVEECERARGLAEGRALELERRVEALAAPRELPTGGLWRATGALALGLLLAGVALAQWGGLLAGEREGYGLRLASGAGALAMALVLFLYWRRELDGLSRAHARATAAKSA